MDALLPIPFCCLDEEEDDGGAGSLLLRQTALPYPSVPESTSFDTSSQLAIEIMQLDPVQKLLPPVSITQLDISSRLSRE